MRREIMRGKWPGQNVIYVFYSDYTYRCVHWGDNASYGKWSVTGNEVYLSDPRGTNIAELPNEAAFCELAKEAHDLIQFDKEIEEFLAEEKRDDQ